MCTHKPDRRTLRHTPTLVERWLHKCAAGVSNVAIELSVAHSVLHGRQAQLGRCSCAQLELELEFEGGRDRRINMHICIFLEQEQKNNNHGWVIIVIIVTYVYGNIHFLCV